MIQNNNNYIVQSVITGPLVITVSTIAVVTVYITVHVTNRLDIVTGDVTRDIPTVTAVNVNL